MKYSRWVGIAASVLLVIACFLPWTFHPDLNKYFTGFFSQENVYGKPGKALLVLCAIAVLFYCIPRIWAKRWNLLVTGMTMAYAIKSFVLFSGCYRGICPVRQTGIWLMLLSAALMLIMAIFTDLKLKDGPAATEKKQPA